MKKAMETSCNNSVIDQFSKAIHLSVQKSAVDLEAVTLELEKLFAKVTASTRAIGSDICFHIDLIENLSALFETCRYAHMGVSALSDTMKKNERPKKEYSGIQSLCNSIFMGLKQLLHDLTTLVNQKKLKEEIQYKVLSVDSSMITFVAENIQKSWRETITGYKNSLLKRKAF
jgi:hypothetical protein